MGKVFGDGGGELGEALPHGLGHDDAARVTQGHAGRFAGGGDRDEAVAEGADGAREAALLAADGEEGRAGHVHVVDLALAPAMQP